MHRLINSSALLFPFHDIRYQLFVTTLEENTALIRMCDTSQWRSVVGLTLNLKQSIKLETGGFVKVDELTAKKAFRHFMNVLNRHIYKAAFRHQGKQLRVVPILERSESGRWHYHVAIEPPVYMESNEFADAAMEAWLQTPLGYGHGEISLYVDAGWNAYMAKRRSKAGFEFYFDCIDTEAFHNPADC